jgi:hypothetical protein
MCTVTYYPNSSGFILTHNRDEAPTRSPSDISKTENGYCHWLYPKDTKAGGTWIVTDNTGNTACLLNGAFVKHHHSPPYRRSRGLILMDCMEAPAPVQFLLAYDYSGIEPFTLLFFTGQTVLQLRWDGQELHRLYLSADAPHFWCSATLYPPDMQVRREQVFQKWLSNQQQVPGTEDFLQLHRTGSVGDPENDFVMNRNERVRTVSITQVVLETNMSIMRYFDLLNDRQDVRSITLYNELTRPPA